MAAWQDCRRAARAGRSRPPRHRLEKARAAWDDGDHRDRRGPQEADGRAPGLQEPAKKALATLDREWDGLIAHRNYPMVSLDNYPDDAVMPMSAVCGGPAAGQGGALAA